MDVYLVGGAVRDALLKRPVREHDYVVVGATPEQMLDLGYRQVGRDFPVFLHPHSKEEYALARTLRRSVGGAKTVVHAQPGVSLRDDLHRRDLTINALARDKEGRLIDYFGGLEDLRNRVLRHVSPAFIEDPIRILRLARFMARYADLGFRVADETQALMADMARNGALDALVPERVWSELDKVLREAHPARFFVTLRECGALQVVFPELDRLWGVPQPPHWHPEVDTGLHTMKVVEVARRLSDDTAVLFAALTHDLGKGETPVDILPSHHGHEQRGVKLVEDLCRRLKAPVRHCDIARLVARHHGLIHRAGELRASTVLKVLEQADAFRRPERLDALLLASEADFRGRGGFEQRPYPQADRFRAWRQAAAEADTEAAIASCADPQQVGEAVARVRLAAIKKTGI